jgi:hypothetical protein
MLYTQVFLFIHYTKQQFLFYNNNNNNNNKSQRQYLTSENSTNTPSCSERTHKIFMLQLSKGSVNILTEKHIQVSCYFKKSIFYAPQCESFIFIHCIKKFFLSSNVEITPRTRSSFGKRLRIQSPEKKMHL